MALDVNDCEATDTLFINGYFVVEPDDLFLIQYPEDATPEYIQNFEGILKNKGTEKIKSCNCKNTIEYLQLWEAKQSLEIHSNTKGAGDPPEVDTSGLGVKYLWQDDKVEVQDGDCVESPGIPNPDNLKSVKVAIIDSGSNVDSELHDYTHPKLKNITWKNPGEPMPINGEDNDENCKTDDLEGYDFLAASNLVIDTLVGHGTHLAGIIADAYPEDINLEIMNIKIFSQDDSEEEARRKGGIFDLICAIHYAVNNGADVINLSLGYENIRPSPALHYALKRAEVANIMVVASAGNDMGRDLDSSHAMLSKNTRWPVRYKQDIVLMDTTLQSVNNMLVVAGLDNRGDNIDISFSNYGPTYVDVAARGTFESTHLEDSYLTLEGTSMSAAEVSRMVSLIKANTPTRSPNQIINVIEATVESIDSAHMVKFGGKIAIDQVLDAFGIRKRRKEAQTLPQSSDILWGKTQFRPDEDVDLLIYLNKNDTTLFYDQVNFRVEELPGNKILYSKEYCSTNKITWDGIMNDKNPIQPSRRNRWLVITIDGQEYRFKLIRG